MKTKAVSLRLSLCLVLLLSSVLVSPFRSVKASANGIVISQIYGGGGNAGSTFKNDFIEIFNADRATVNLSGWSVQYASAAGTTW
ncbi:MAG TPA: lamin tail domain-containing protein, partial [Candidatus Angelobacter sp.]